MPRRQFFRQPRNGPGSVVGPAAARPAFPGPRQRCRATANASRCRSVSIVQQLFRLVPLRPAATSSAAAVFPIRSPLRSTLSPHATSGILSAIFSSTALLRSVLLPAIFSCGVSAFFMYPRPYRTLRILCRCPSHESALPYNFGLRDVDEIRKRAESFSDGLGETEADGFENLFG
jgi:hypothetical protein